MSNYIVFIVLCFVAIVRGSFYFASIPNAMYNNTVGYKVKDEALLHLPLQASDLLPKKLPCRAQRSYLGVKLKVLLCSMQLFDIDTGAPITQSIVDAVTVDQQRGLVYYSSNKVLYVASQTSEGAPWSSSVMFNEMCQNDTTSHTLWEVSDLTFINNNLYWPCTTMSQYYGTNFNGLAVSSDGRQPVGARTTLFSRVGDIAIIASSVMDKNSLLLTDFYGMTGIYQLSLKSPTYQLTKLVDGDKNQCDSIYNAVMDPAGKYIYVGRWSPLQGSAANPIVRFAMPVTASSQWQSVVNASAIADSRYISLVMFGHG